jgi:hypothetical protein
MKHARLPLLILLLIGALFLTTGCFPIALRPWYEEGDLEFDPTFLGIQMEADGKRTEWTQKSEFVYRVIHADRDGKKTLMYDARLFRTHGYRFLDISPVPIHEAGASVPTMPLVEGHIVYLVRGSWKERKDWATPLNLDWLEKFLKRNPRALRHEFVQPRREAAANDDGESEPHPVLILTDTTENLQRFLAQSVRIPGAFPVAN